MLKLENNEQRGGEERGFLDLPTGGETASKGTKECGEPKKGKKRRGGGKKNQMRAFYMLEKRKKRSKEFWVFF